MSTEASSGNGLNRCSWAVVLRNVVCDGKYQLPDEDVEQGTWSTWFVPVRRCSTTSCPALDSTTTESPVAPKVELTPTLVGPGAGTSTVASPTIPSAL